MAEIINLRIARKGKKRTDAEKTAATNRAKHGRTKTDKQRDALEKSRTEKVMEGHKVEEEEET